VAGAVFAVADGMGGHAAGEVASALAVARLEELAQRAGLGPDDVRAWLVLANQDILADAELNPDRTGMGTTAAGLCLVEVAGSEHWIVFNVGDSRVYRYADDALVQLTVDHNEVTELGAAKSDSRNVVTRALGTDPAPEPDLWVVPAVAGDRFLVCSDGLTLELDEARIAAVLHREPVAQHAAEALVAVAVAAGGRDNVTAVVVDHVSAPGGAGELDGSTMPRRGTAGAGR
jgi:protein phosphatase